jgi:hypothetical protein
MEYNRTIVLFSRGKIFNAVAVGTLVPVIVYSVKAKVPAFFSWDGHLFYVEPL